MSRKLEDKQQSRKKLFRNSTFGINSYYPICKELLKFKIKKTSQFKNGPKILTDISPKKRYGWQVYEDNPPHPMWSGKWKLKQHCSTPLKWPKSRMQRTSMVARMWSNNTHSLLVRIQNGKAIPEDNFAVYYKITLLLLYPSSSLAPWYLPKGAESLCTHKKLYMDAYSSSLFTIMEILK